MSTPAARPSSGAALRRARRCFAGAALLALGFPAAIIVATFPYATDRPLTAAEVENNRNYYAAAYQAPDREYATRHLRVAREAALRERIEERIREFVRGHHLEDQPVLEIGSGRGYLQDAARDYTGLDISPTVARFYRKPFV